MPQKIKSARFGNLSLHSGFDEKNPILRSAILFFLTSRVCHIKINMADYRDYDGLEARYG